MRAGTRCQLDALERALVDLALHLDRDSQSAEALAARLADVRRHQRKKAAEASKPWARSAN